MRNQISVLVDELKERYDYISKIDGIRFLKNLTGADIGTCLKAWKLAYE